MNFKRSMGSARAAWEKWLSHRWRSSGKEPPGGWVSADTVQCLLPVLATQSVTCSRCKQRAYFMMPTSHAEIIAYDKHRVKSLEWDTVQSKSRTWSFPRGIHLQMRVVRGGRQGFFFFADHGRSKNWGISLISTRPCTHPAIQGPKMSITSPCHTDCMRRFTFAVMHWHGFF